MRSSMFKDYIKININKPSNEASTPRESMGVAIQILLNRIFITVEVSTTSYRPITLPIMHENLSKIS